MNLDELRQEVKEEEGEEEFDELEWDDNTKELLDLLGQLHDFLLMIEEKPIGYKALSKYLQKETTKLRETISETLIEWGFGNEEEE